MKRTIDQWTPNVPLAPHRGVMDKMNDPNPLLANRLSPHVAKPLARAPDAASRRVRCRFARGSDSGPGLTDEMSCLLRTRLRLALLIILAGFTLHFLRNWLLQGSPFDHRPLWLFLMGCELTVLGIVSALLWSRRP